MIWFLGQGRIGKPLAEHPALPIDDPLVDVVPDPVHQLDVFVVPGELIGVEEADHGLGLYHQFMSLTMRPSSFSAYMPPGLRIQALGAGVGDADGDGLAALQPGPVAIGLGGFHQQPSAFNVVTEGEEGLGGAPIVGHVGLVVEILQVQQLGGHDLDQLADLGAQRRVVPDAHEVGIGFDQVQVGIEGLAARLGVGDVEAFIQPVPFSVIGFKIAAVGLVLAVSSSRA